MREQRFDIHEHITQQIVTAIEAGVGEFQLPWRRSKGCLFRPVELRRGSPIRGNVLMLWGAGILPVIKPGSGALTDNGPN